MGLHHWTWIVALAAGAAQPAPANDTVLTVRPGANSAAIQEVIDRAASLEPKPATVLLPRGNFTVDNTIRLRPGTHLKGEGAHTRLVITKRLPLVLKDARPALRVEGSTPEAPVIIEDLSLTSTLPHDQTTPGEEGGSLGILILNSDTVIVRRCRLERMYSGVSARGSRRCSLERLEFLLTNWALSFTAGEADVRRGDHVITNCRFIPFLHVAVNVWKQDGCRLLDNYARGQSKRSGGAYFFTSCSDRVVRGNVAARGENGIQFVVYGGRPSDRNLVEDNIVYGCHPFSPTGTGISLQADYAGSFRDNVFRGNTIFDCDAGIAISQPNPKYKGPSANTLIENNDISGCVEWGILLDGARTVMIRNNRIVGSRFVGIELRKSRSGYASTHNTIEGNFLRDNAVCGLLISEGNDYNKIVRNRLTDNFKGEIRVVRSSHTLIVDNLIHETMNYNKYWNDSTNGIALKGGEDNRVHNNTYYWQQD